MSVSVTSPAPRVHAVLDRLDAWGDRSTARAWAKRVAVTVTGPLVVLVGVAMLVLPGPGLVVMGVGMALLAVEYPWARRVVGAAGRGLARLRELVLPRGAGAGRRALGGVAVAAFGVAGFVATTAITAFLGAHTLL